MNNTNVVAFDVMMVIVCFGDVLRLVGLLLLLNNGKSFCSFIRETDRQING